MTAEDITTLRLLNQGISSSRFISPLAVTQHLGALQAQDYYGSLWALGLRTGLAEKDIIRAVEDRQIIRTWSQRGTLHFVPADDAKWLVDLSSDRILRNSALRRKRLGLEDKTLALSKSALTDALKGVSLTRPQVLAELEHVNITTTAGRGYHILFYLGQMGVIYIGPMQGKQQTFGLLDELVPHPVSLTRQQSIVELAKRYFLSHGPALIRDFTGWTGLTLADAKMGIAANSDLLYPETVNGETYWIAKDIAASIDSDEAFLLPGFDEYMLGYKDRSAALHIDHAQKIVPGSNGMFLSTIVIRGEVVGTWKRVVKKDHVLLVLTPFRHLTKADQKLLRKPAQSYGRFLNLEPKLEINN